MLSLVGFGAASVNEAHAQVPETPSALPAEDVPSDPGVAGDAAGDALGDSAPVSAAVAEVPPGMHSLGYEGTPSEHAFLVSRQRRLRATRWAGAALLTAGTLMGVLSPAARNPFAWGMTGVSLTGAGLLVLAPSSGLYRSLQAEQGAIDPSRWAAMRRIRRRGGIALVSVGFAALSFTAMTRDPEVIVIIGLPLGLPLAFAGSILLLASMNATPVTPRVQPTFSATAGRAGRGARMGVSVVF